MAQKQIIWSGYSKKMLYSVLESLIGESDNTEQAQKFFKSFSEKMRLLVKEPGKSFNTSEKDVYAIYFDNYLILFEDRESELIIHWVSRMSRNDK